MEAANVMQEEVMITMMKIIETFVFGDFSLNWLTDIALFCIVLLVRPIRVARPMIGIRPHRSNIPGPRAMRRN